MTTISHWPDRVRSVGINVIVHPEVNRLSHGNFKGEPNIVWHHDASPPGDSPGALAWMKSNFARASAQIWVDRAGTWHFISFGVAYHAGAVNDSAFDNWHAVGIETDHTTGEAWPDAQLDSLRRGTAAILAGAKKGAGSLAFHKTICKPRGRKSDPDGLDLAHERIVVSGYINGGLPGAPAPVAPTPAPAPAGRPPVLPWPFPRSHYVGDIKGPAASHGGYYASERPFIKNVQQWLIYRGAVPGVDPGSWATSGWADGRFEAPYSTEAAARWSRGHYPGQPYPSRIYADDYRVLTG